MGAERIAPGIPHIQDQKTNEMTTSKALTVSVSTADGRQRFAFDQMNDQIGCGWRQGPPFVVDSVIRRGKNKNAIIGPMIGAKFSRRRRRPKGRSPTLSLHGGGHASPTSKL